MPNPVKRTNLSEQIFEQLRDEILNRVHQPGQRLPAERELCRIMQVNRGPMREALKRLEQAGLIQIRQGDGSIVLDYELHGGLELLPSLAMPGGRPNVAAVRSMFECRALIAPEMARLAAIRIEPQALEELTELVSRIEACTDLPQVQDLDLEFHGALARASGNLAYRLIFNSARDLYLRFRRLLVQMFDYPPRTRTLYRRIRDAIAERDAERARELCVELMDYNGKRALAALDQLTAARKGPVSR